MAWEEEIAFLKEQAREAGAIMRRYFRGSFNVYTKPDLSKVTEVDLKISALVQHKVAAAFPDVRLYSEESDNPPIDARRDHFIVDELDGTSYFIEKFKGFSHQCAFYHGEAGLVVGLVYYPIDDIMVYAARGQGVWIERQGRPERVPPRKNGKPLSELTFAHPARYRGDKYRDFYHSFGVDRERLLPTTARRTLQFVRGELDVAIFLIRRIPEWDWAGEKVIVEELGFNHSYLDGRAIVFGEAPPADNAGYLICHPDHETTLRRAYQDWLIGI